MKLRSSRFAILFLLFVVLAQTNVLPLDYEGGGSGGGGSSSPAQIGDTDNPEQLLRNLYAAQKPTYSLIPRDTRPDIATASNLRTLYTLVGVPIGSYVAQILT